eukprot:jgi/Tetstr1/423200/TSEL_001320.t1
MPPAARWCFDRGARGGASQLDFFESTLLSFRSATCANGCPKSVVALVKPHHDAALTYALSFKGRASQSEAAHAAWSAYLLFFRLILRPMADSPPGSLPPDPVADYRDNRLSHWERGDLDTLFALARTHASVRATPHDYAAPASANCEDPPPVSKRQAARASALAAVGEYSRAAAALHSVPLAPTGPRLHKELLRLHPQTPDPVPCALPDPFSLDRLTFPEASVDVCEVLSSSPNGSAPFLDGIRFEALRALCSRSHLRGIAEAIANAEVPAGVAHFLSSATLVPLDKLTPAERNALELSAGDMKGSVRPIGIGSVLVRFAMRVLLRAHGEPIAQWLAARGQFGFGVKGGVELVQFLVRSLLDSDPSLVLVQLDAENAFKSFYRSEMFRTLLEDPVWQPLLRSAIMLYGQESNLYVFDGSQPGPSLRIPSRRGARQGCVLGLIPFAAVAARVYARIGAAAPSHSVLAAFSDDVNLVGTGDGLALATWVAPSAFAAVGLSVTIRKRQAYCQLGSSSPFGALPFGHLLHGVAVSSSGIKVLGAPVGSGTFARELLDKTVERFHQFGSRLVGLADHFHSHTATRLLQVCGRRFGHHLRSTPRGLGRSEGYGDTIPSFLEDADAAAFSTLAGIWGVSPDLLDTPSMRTQLSLPVQFGGLGIGDNVVIADASHIGAAALVVGQAVTFLRAQHATLSDAGAFFSDPSGVSSPHSLYLVGASSIHQAMATPTLELDAGANASAPMWAVELRAAHTRVVEECGDAVLEDLAGPLASALKLLPSKRSHIARAGCSAAGAEPASAMRSAADLRAIPHYSDFPLHSMRKVQETLSHRIHTVRFAKLVARMPTSGPDSNRFRGRLLRAATAFLVTDPPSEGRLGEVRERSPEYYDSMFRVAACRPFGLPAAPVLSLGEPCPCASCSFSVQGMLARFEDAGVEFTPSTWAVAYADHVARCSGGVSNHAAHEWAAHGLSDICHDVKSALGVGVQILTDPSVLVSLPKGSDGRPADVGLFGYGGIRGNTVAIDTTIAPILGVSSSDPTTALRAAERHKIQKYDEGVRNAAGMLRFVPFAVSEFGSLAPHAEAFLVELAKASHTHTGQKIGQLLSAWRRRFSLLINMAHADNVLGGVASARAARDGTPAPASRRSSACVAMTRVIGCKRPRRG